MADYIPTVPQSDRAVQIWTYNDTVERVLDLFAQKRSIPRQLRLAKDAVQEAYRDIRNRHRWASYERRMTFQTDASFETGTLSYDHTGGTYERQLTFTDAFPSWTVGGKIRIGTGYFEIESVKSSKVATLKEHSNPGSDVTDSTFCLVHSLYLMPPEVRYILQIIDTQDRTQIQVISMRLVQRNSIVSFPIPSTPYDAAVNSDPAHYGSLALEFSPGPAQSRTYDYTYIAYPRDLIIEKYSTGSVSLGAGSTTVTLAGGVFPETCVGSVIRFSKDNIQEPTGLIGSTEDIDNPYTAERFITERVSDTEVTIDESISTGAVGPVMYTISDPLDIDPKVMLDAMFALSEAEFAKRIRNKGEELSRYQKDAQISVLRAKELDQRADKGGTMAWRWRNKGTVDVSKMIVGL